MGSAKQSPVAYVASVFILLAPVLCATALADESHGLSYPPTPRGNLVEEIHGRSIVDPYRWLEPSDAPEVRAWSRAESDLTAAYLEDFPGRDSLAKRLQDLVDVPWTGAPWYAGGRAFYHAQPKGAQKDILFWRPEGEDDGRVLIDPNSLRRKDFDGREAANVELGRWSVSRDGKTIAYALKPNAGDEGWIEVMDVESGRLSEVDRLDDIKHSRMEWTPDGAGFYYTRLPKASAVPETDRPGLAEIRYHRLGSPQSDDPLIFPATGDPTTFLRPKVSWNGRWLFVYVWRGHNGVTVYLKDLESEGSDFRVFFDSKDAQIWVFDKADEFYITSSQDAPNGKLLRVKAGLFDPTAWEEVIAEDPDAVLVDVMPSRDRLLVVTLKNAQHQLTIYDLDGNPLQRVALPAPGSTRWFKVNPERDDAYFTFSSYVYPWTTFKLDMTDGALAVWSHSDVPVDVDRYESLQRWFTSADGTRVPMIVVRDPTQPLDGSTPFLLTGYGGFNNSLIPSFWATIQPWLEAGGGFAVANLRGGGEFGKDWHRAGMRHNKQNVFDDFIAATEFLIEQGYSSPERLAIAGWSNGGLLVAAAITQRPELFGAALAGVPLTDMLRYTSLGVGKTWIEEYGDPAIAEDFAALAAYSPYHRIEPGRRYPPTLVTTAAYDDRVHPAHARKFTAALQNADPAENLVLFTEEAEAGHGGGKRTDDEVRTYTRNLSFLMKVFGMTPSPYGSESGD